MAGPSHNPYSRSANPSTRSYDSSFASSATSPRGSYESWGLPGRTARSNGAPLPHPIGIPPPFPSSHHGHPSNFQNPYTTPVTAGSMMGRDSLPSTGSLPGTPTLSHDQLPSSGNAQKRAYRSRRKDPSCDACRERKVKCDATGDKACSECASRGVNCQFTKETNRRMTTFKQFQDLESQVKTLRRENDQLNHHLLERDAHLKQMLRHQPGHLDVDVDGGEPFLHSLPGSNTEPTPKRRPLQLQSSGRARSNIQKYSRGIWKAPASFQPCSATRAVPWPQVQLPPKDLVDQLVRTYYTTAHTMMPILHYTTFHRSVEDLYRHGNQPDGGPASFLSMFFSVLAVGSVFGPESQHDHRQALGAEMIETAHKFVDAWTDDYELDHARTFVLMAYYLGEMNMKAAAVTRLNMAISAAYDLGLHLEPARSYPFIEGEMRRRTWWAIYVLDRGLSLELGRPALVDDSECDVSRPAAVDDHFIHDNGISNPHGGEALTHPFLAIIHVIRSYASLKKALSSPVIAATSLATFDQHFTDCLRTFPPTCGSGSPGPLEPKLVNAMVYLLHARLLLHRHNLSPACPPDVRRAAMEQCTDIAVETAGYISRTGHDWYSSATTMLLLHTFRCALFLILAGRRDAIMICVQALESVQSRLDITVPCGRYLAFFTSTLVEKRAEIEGQYSRLPKMSPFTDPPSVRDALLQDEEVLAYVSADLQASPETAWIWGDGDARSGPSAQGGPPSAGPSTLSAGAPPHGQPSVFRSRVSLTDEERGDWGGWTRLGGLIRDFMAFRSPPPPPPPPGTVPSNNWAGPPPPPHSGPAPHQAIKSEPISARHALQGLPPPPPSINAAASPAHQQQQQQQSGEESNSDDSPTSAGAKRRKVGDRISIANILG